MKKVLVVIQAHMRSTRLPGKVLAEINGKPLIEILIHHFKLAIEDNYVATLSTT
jgi:spore coat polysaccharide biosynthesis protein SpsF (cytidylyltransferase family)